MTTDNLAEDNLRCEYYVQIVGRFVESRPLQGGFDMPLALGKRPFDYTFYLAIYGQMFESCITYGACVIFREFLKAQHEKSRDGAAPGFTDQPVVNLTPLHPDIHQDNLRLEASIRVFGRNVTLLSYDANFTMPGGLLPESSQNYQAAFKDYVKGLVISRAETILHHFFKERRIAARKAQDQSAQNTYVDGQSWNFGSESLTSAMEQEQPAVRKAA